MKIFHATERKHMHFLPFTMRGIIYSKRTTLITAVWNNGNGISQNFKIRFLVDAIFHVCAYISTLIAVSQLLNLGSVTITLNLRHSERQ